MAIEVNNLLELSSAAAKAVYACGFSGDGHDWLDVTTVGSHSREYQCARCDAKGTEQEAH